MADAPATKKDLDALQKSLQKQIDDLKKWADALVPAQDKQNAALTKGLNDVENWAKGEFDKLFKTLNEVVKVINK